MGDQQKILQLLQENKCLKLQIQQWKDKYYNLYSAFLNSSKNSLPMNHSQLEQQIASSLSGPRQQLKINLNITNQLQINNQQSSKPYKFDNGQHHQSSHRQNELNILNTCNPIDSSLALIESCFIFEKKRSKGFKYIKHAYPQAKDQINYELYDTIYRYVFIDEEISEIIDDQQNSFKNQILYGSNYQYFHFVFDVQNQKHPKTTSNLFLKEANIMLKKHIYGIIKPQILKIDDRFYETQIAIGFISQFPISSFFKNMTRFTQQEIKLKLLNSPQIGELQDRLSIMASITQGIMKYSINNQLSINGFPINLTISTNLFNIDLKYTLLQGYTFDQLMSLQNTIGNYNKKKLIKILHYILAQKSIIIICKSRKSLNQLFQIIRIIMHPLNWVFPIVYSYSNYYEPFFNSPIPILIGCVRRDYYQDWEIDTQQQLFASNDFIEINAEDDSSDSKQIPQFSKRIKKCEKFISKEIKAQTVLKQNLLSEDIVKKIVENSLVFKLYYYIQKLLKSVCQPCTQQQEDQFLMRMSESQMISYYRQDK